MCHASSNSEILYLPFVSLRYLILSDSVERILPDTLEIADASLGVTLPLFRSERVEKRLVLNSWMLLVC